MLTKNELLDEHLSLWLSVRGEVLNKLSNTQGLRCICGRLATGLHEDRCSKFQNKVDKATVNRCNELLDRSNVTQIYS